MAPASWAEQSILDSFDYHRPSPEQAVRIESNRLSFKHTAFVVLRNCRDGADRDLALQLLHTAMMVANKTIATEPGTPHESPPADVLPSVPSLPSPMDDDDRTP